MVEIHFGNTFDAAAFMRFSAVKLDVVREKVDQIFVYGRPLEPDRALSVGRGGDISIHRHVNWISRHHMEIKADSSGTLWIRDLDSKVGTFINKKRVCSGHWTLVKPTDTIFFGPGGLPLEVIRRTAFAPGNE